MVESSQAAPTTSVKVVVASLIVSTLAGLGGVYLGYVLQERSARKDWKAAAYQRFLADAWPDEPDEAHEIIKVKSHIGALTLIVKDEVWTHLKNYDALLSELGSKFDRSICAIPAHDAEVKALKKRITAQLWLLRDAMAADLR